MNNEKIDYVEFPSRDLAATKLFFGSVFSWEFVDYGKDYVAFNNAGIKGGFFSSELTVSAKTGSVLLVFYSVDLESTLKKVEKNQGEISEPIFSFPGGRRFHFLDPTGNEFAVWSDKESK